jgi:RHS repeat-associated protein
MFGNDSDNLTSKKKDGKAHHLILGNLGSSSVVVNQAGRVEQRGYYLPWGGNRAGRVSITDYGYTGQMKEGDIYYYGARWYDPAIGRFMQADTIVPMASQGTQAFDRYAYVNNNPLRYTDPTGHYYHNVLMSDAGGGFEAPRFPSGVINYAQGIRGFGGYLLIPTSFSQKEQSIIFNAFVHMVRGVERLGVNDGRAWIQKNMTGFITKNHVPGMRDKSFVLPKMIFLHQDFTNPKWRVPTGNPAMMMTHEQAHVYSGMNTYIDLERGMVSDLMGLIENKFSSMFTSGSLGPVQEDYQLSIGDQNYWSNAPADYFAEVFTALIVNPNHHGVPQKVRDYMIDLILRSE